MGILEKFNQTLAVMEYKLPQYFKRASSVNYMDGYRIEKKLNSSRMKPRKISERTKQILRNNMTQEIEFYDFCVQRLLNQFEEVNKNP